MKKLTFLKSLFLLCALIVGSSSAWADEEPVVTADFTTAAVGNSNYTNTWTYGDWSLTNCANNNKGWAYIRCGGKGGTQATSTTTSTTTIQGTKKIDYDIKEVKVYHNGTSNNAFTVNSVVLEVSSVSNFSSISNEIELTPTITKEAAGTVSFTTGAPYAKDSYYRVKINWTVKGKTNYGLDVTKVEFYEAESSTDPTISADDVELGSDDTSGEITYSILNAPSANTEVTASSNDAWISNIIVNEGTKKVSFTTTANTEIVERVGTITLTYRNTDTDEDLDAIDVTITQAKAIVTLYYSLATTVVPGKHYIITNGKEGTIKVMGEQASNNRTSNEVTTTSTGKLNVSSDDGIYEFLIEGDLSTGYYTIYDAVNSGYLYAASGSSNHLKVQTTNNANGKWTIEIDENGVATIKAQGTNSHNWMRNNGNLFSCYASGQADIYLFERDGDTGTQTTTITLNGSGYATYSSTLDFEVSSGEKAYTAKLNTTDKKITCSEIEGKIPVGAGVLLYGDANAEVTLLITTGATALGDNDLKGTTTAGGSLATMEGSKYYYALSGDTFKHFTGAEFAANKAYFESDTELNSKAFAIVFEGETTGINGIEEVAPVVTKTRKVVKNGRLVIETANGEFTIDGARVK